MNLTKKLTTFAISGLIGVGVLSCGSPKTEEVYTGVILKESLIVYNYREKYVASVRLTDGREIVTENREGEGAARLYVRYNAGDTVKVVKRKSSINNNYWMMVEPKQDSL